jgi:2-phosphosulfolactate phosphatase
LLPVTLSHGQTDGPPALPRAFEAAMSPFDQSAAECRLEWGAEGVRRLAPADVTIVVDVLSFTTCVDIATGRGAEILPYAWKSDSAAEYAQRQGAELAVHRGDGRYTLSPACFLNAPAGLRCVLPSLNGASTALAAAGVGVVLAGCLRNAAAVARAAQACGRTFNVCPAGERWPDGSLRPAVEDWLGAGAILCRLPGRPSPEARAAIAAFQQLQSELGETIAQSSSGRELIERGYARDVELAAALDASEHASRLVDTAFVRI